MIKLPPQFLKGSYPPVITPFLENGAVDYATYERLVNFQIREGSHGIVVCGTSAEPSALTVTERQQLLETALRVAKGRVPVVAATGSQSHAETVALTDHATWLGADALLVVTPYYIRPPQRGLVAYFNDLGRRTDLPILMYHIPGRAAVTVTLDTLEQILAATPHLVGIKHAAPELALVSEALARFGPEFRIFVGLEELSLPMLAIGACGMVNAVSNIAPRRVADLYAAVASGDMAQARRLHFELYDLNRAVFFDTNPIPIKYMAKKLGILAGNHHRLPMMPATLDVERRLDAVLEAARLLQPNAIAAEISLEPNMTARNVILRAADGGPFDAYRATPSKVPAAGIIVLQEIFGVNAFVRSVCDELAAAGFLAVAPDLFWRQERNVNLSSETPEGRERGLKLMHGLNENLAVSDATDALAYMRSLRECTGKVGVLGYCLGGKLAYLMAARAQVDVAVSYYGVGIHSVLNEASDIRAPMLLHIAAEDQLCPPPAQEQIHRALSAVPNVTLRTHQGVGHAFARKGSAAANAAVARDG